MTDINKKISQDEELSDFADRVLKGQTKTTASDSDQELRGLEETILRLQGSMPSSSLEESTKKQMLVRLNARFRKEQPQKKSFWASLFDTQGIQTQSRQQFIVAVGILAVLIVAVIAAPILGTGDPSTTTGTALSGSYGIIFLMIGLIALIIGILWSIRRK